MGVPGYQTQICSAARDREREREYAVQLSHFFFGPSPNVYNLLQKSDFLQCGATQNLLIYLDKLRHRVVAVVSVQLGLPRSHYTRTCLRTFSSIIFEAIDKGDNFLVEIAPALLNSVRHGVSSYLLAALRRCSFVCLDSGIFFQR